MRLSHIEAVRFGRLEDVAVGPLGAGLNVVQGPNGAGKTSFTTLVRYVLYGFPRRNDKAEADYESSAGKRLGRLTFSDPSGEWVVERTEGVRGGEATVRELVGAARGDLVARTTHGVSRNEFRVVFGFGLQDMADIEPGSGSDGVLSRLYAARVGLAVSPQDVRNQIDASAAALYKPRGSTPRINAILRESTALKKQIREIEDEASRYASQRERLAELRASLDELRTQRDTTATRRTTLDTYAEKLEAIEEKLQRADVDAHELRAEENRVRTEIEDSVVDEALLEHDAQIAALLDDVSGYRERLSALARLETRAAEAKRGAVQALESVALDEDHAAGVVMSPDSKVGIERHRDLLARAQVRVDAASRALDDATGRLQAAEQTTVPSQTVASLIPAAVVGGLGLVTLALGLVFSQWVSVAVGAVLVVVGGVLAFAARSKRPSAAPESEARSSALELARVELERADKARAELLEEWLSWAGERGLLAGGREPEAAALMFGAVEQWRRDVSEYEMTRDEAVALRAQCDRFRDSLASLVGERLVALASASLDDVPALASQVRGLLTGQLEARRLRDEARARLGTVATSLARIDAERAATIEARDELLQRLELTGADSAHVRALAVEARSAADEADEEYEQLAGEVNRLDGELNSQGRDVEMADARLALTGLRERLAESAERYVVLATASRLVGETQAYYERARQPEVVRRAGQIFSEITQGRYDRISIPAGGGEIVAFCRSEATPCSHLSRGSQEQLYLALRLALVEQLDEVGEGLPVLMDDIFANFDPERHTGAAKAVAELARHRQVVFFTCHPQVADLFATIDPGHTRLELERC